jgi:hypothetical protein
MLSIAGITWSFYVLGVGYFLDVLGINTIFINTIYTAYKLMKQQLNLDCPISLSVITSSDSDTLRQMSPSFFSSSILLWDELKIFEEAHTVTSAFCSNSENICHD